MKKLTDVENALKTIEEITGVDWEDYYQKGKDSLKKRLEGDPEMFDRWTKSDARYMLVSYIMIVENSFVGSGLVTGHCDMHISSDSIENLKIVWREFLYKIYDNTHQHFIVDMKERKVVEFLSVCM